MELRRSQSQVCDYRSSLGAQGSRAPRPLHSDTGQARTMHLTSITDSPASSSGRSQAWRTPSRSLDTNYPLPLRHFAHVYEPEPPPPAQPQSYLSMEQIKQNVIELKNINFIPRYLLEYFQKAEPTQPESEQTANSNHPLDSRKTCSTSRDGLDPRISCNVSNQQTDMNSNSILDSHNTNTRLHQQTDTSNGDARNTSNVSDINCNSVPDTHNFNSSRPYPEPETPVSRAWTTAARTSASFSDTENNNEEVQHGRYNRNSLYKFHNFNQNSLVYSLRGSFSSFDDSMSEDRVIFASTSAARPLGKFNPPRFAGPPSYSHNSPVLYPLPPSLCPPFYQRKCNPSLCRPLVFK